MGSIGLAATGDTLTVAKAILIMLIASRRLAISTGFFRLVFGWFLVIVVLLMCSGLVPDLFPAVRLA
jgi:hypothetical protein